jgi:CRISPR-associated protein Cas5d
MQTNVRLRVWGEYACYTRPEMKVERVSYDVMTPSAARGILEAIHWKPAIQWIVDEIHVLKPIRFQSIRRNEVGAKIAPGAIHKAMKSGEVGGLHLEINGHRQQRAATVLADVDYVICAHFVMTDRAGECDNPQKHYEIFTRHARKGQCFHQPCLGNREFPTRFELIEPEVALPVPEERTADLGFGAPRDLGFMLYDIDHARDRRSLFFRATLDRGVVRVLPPNSQEIRR